MQQTGRPVGVLRQDIRGRTGGPCGLTKRRLFRQGLDNFKKEFEQLRRAFRYDEFMNVTNANPPSNKFEQVGGAALTSCQEAMLPYQEDPGPMVHVPDDVHAVTDPRPLQFSDLER